jgi:hypothetical protein
MMRRLSALVASAVFALAVAGPAAAVQPTIDQPSFPTTFNTYCGDVELVVNVTFSKVTEYFFYDQAGNLVRYLERGPYQFQIVAPNGNSLTMFSNAMFIFDVQNGRLENVGLQLFVGDNTLISKGQFDYLTGTVRGIFTDLCPQLGYPAS